MKSSVLLVWLTGAALFGCTYLPTSGPTAGEVIDRGVQENQIRYDVIDVDPGVVATLLAQPAESFRTRFGKYGMPAAPKIGIGDTLSVSIWEAAGGGLFGTSPTEHVWAGSRSGTSPEQVVGRDGGVSVPFADRVPAAGRLPVEVQKAIEQRLAEKAIERQVRVTVSKSVSIRVTVPAE